MVFSPKGKRYPIAVSMDLDGQLFEISTRFSDTTRAGQGAKYLCSGEIDKRTGVEVAIACLFAPLNEVQEGANEDEIEQAIDDSRTAFEHYMCLARMRCKGRSRQKGAVVQLPQTESRPVEQNPEQSDKPVSQQSGADSDAGLDLDNEVF
jgi:hypothetical protein